MRSFSLLRIPPHHLQAQGRLAREPEDGRPAYRGLQNVLTMSPSGRQTGRRSASPHHLPPSATALSCSSVGLDTPSPRCHVMRGHGQSRRPNSEATSSAVSGWGGGGSSSPRPLARCDTTVFLTLRGKKNTRKAGPPLAVDPRPVRLGQDGACKLASLRGSQALLCEHLSWGGGPRPQGWHPRSPLRPRALP